VAVKNIYYTGDIMKIKFWKKTMPCILIVLTVLALFTFLFLNKAEFGKNPSGERLERIKKSAYYKNGKFQNITPTAMREKNFAVMMINYFLRKDKRVKPDEEIPAVKTDLKNLSVDEDIAIWFGHSSYLLQVDGKKFLIDPVFAFKNSLSYKINPPFKGTDIYTPFDFPEIDYLIITHDHWDHLDCDAVKNLKFEKVICPLGVGETLEFWGIAKEKITELEWYEEQELTQSVQIDCLPARHFSGRRGLFGNKTLWASYMLIVKEFRIYIGGDSGYDKFFAQIGEKYGGINIAFLDNGQYDKDWEKIHALPEQTYQAAKDLKTEILFPVHNSKFAIAKHAWDAPLIEIAKAAQGGNIKLFTPKIGQIVNLKDKTQIFETRMENAAL
jgi:L-ascorbate metabolism protein UlaG (beta-lactamase superfamily)